MIIFYKKDTGEIIGNIEGRIHEEEHLRMWIGDKEKTGRIVCNWIKKGEDEDYIYFEPEKQPKIFSKLDKDSKKLKNYKVKNERLMLKNK